MEGGREPGKTWTTNFLIVRYACCNNDNVWLLGIVVCR